MNFQIGDRVIVINIIYDVDLLYKTGTVICFENNWVGIKFDDFSLGHNLKGNINDNSGYFVREENIKLIEENIKINIKTGFNNKK